MAIPENRPVNFDDLQKLQLTLELTNREFMDLFGFTAEKWAAIRRTKAQKLPIRDPAVAVFARFLDRHPEYAPIRPPPKASVLVENIRSSLGQIGALSVIQRGETDASAPIEFNERMFAVALGRGQAAGYRWSEGKGGRQAALILNIFRTIEAVVVPTPSRATYGHIWAELAQFALIEGRARGIPNVFETLNWFKDTVSPTPKAIKRGVRPLAPDQAQEFIKERVEAGREKRNADARAARRRSK